MYPAAICSAFMLPGSRWPRVREPMTKSCVPSRIGASNWGMSSGRSLPSPSRNTTMSQSRVAQALLGSVAEREAVIAAHRERGDAAGQRFAMRGEIHQRPRAAAERPGLTLLLAPEARPGLRGARGVEDDAQRPRHRLGLGDQRALRSIHLLEEGGLRTRVTLGPGE